MWLSRLAMMSNVSGEQLDHASAVSDSAPNVVTIMAVQRIDMLVSYYCLLHSEFSQRDV